MSMKINKLKTLLIAVCCLVIASWSETQGMQKISWVDTEGVELLNPLHENHVLPSRIITVDFSDNNKLKNPEKVKISELVKAMNATTCNFINYNDNIKDQVDKFSVQLKKLSPSLIIYK